jgi:hypothetical protein
MSIHKTSFHITSFCTKRPFYKTSIDTKCPWIQNVLLYKMSNLQNVQHTKCPQIQNVLLYKTSIHTKRPSLLQSLCLFSRIHRSVSSTKSTTITGNIRLIYAGNVLLSLSNINANISFSYIPL